MQKNNVTIDDLPNEMINYIIYFTLQEKCLIDLFKSVYKISLINKNFRALILHDNYNSLINDAFKYYLNNNKKKQIINDLFKVSCVNPYTNNIIGLLVYIIDTFKKYKIKNKELLKKFALFLNNNKYNIEKINKINKCLNKHLIKAIRYDNINLVKLLVHFCNLNFKNKNQKSALILSTYNNNIKITAILLKNHADVNIQDSAGNTPLIIACINNNYKLVKLLLDYNANLDIKDNTDNTALNWAIINSNKNAHNAILHIDYLAMNYHKSNYSEILKLLMNTKNKKFTTDYHQ